MNIILLIVGLPLSVFIPGYLVARIWFKELSELEKVALGFVFSIAITIATGIFLGYNETMKNITGGITSFNLWIYLGSIAVILFCIYLIKNRKEYEFLFKK